MERSLLGNSWKEGASPAREPACTKEGRHQRMPVRQARVRHVGEEAELDRDICVPMWVASGSAQCWVEGRKPGWQDLSWEEVPQLQRPHILFPGLSVVH